MEGHAVSPFILRVLLLALLLSPGVGWAVEIPNSIAYQGRVAVQGTNFHGAGLFKFALVSADGLTSYWSHDLSSVNGSAPASALSLPVTRGLFYVQLGDTNLPGMAALPENVFRDATPRLRVWFSDGVGAFEQFSPDHILGSVPYALVAGQVRSGSVGTNALDADVYDRFVDSAGDTMSGPLAIVGGTGAGEFIFETFSGTNRVGWARKK